MVVWCLCRLMKNFHGRPIQKFDRSYHHPRCWLLSIPLPLQNCKKFFTKLYVVRASQPSKRGVKALEWFLMSCSPKLIKFPGRPLLFTISTHFENNLQRHDTSCHADLFPRQPWSLEDLACSCCQRGTTHNWPQNFGEFSYVVQCWGG